MIRLIATDLDGTLLERDGSLPEDTFEVVRMLNEQGIRFAASSGRQYGNLVRLFAPVADRMAFVCENGAFCMVEGLAYNINYKNSTKFTKLDITLHYLIISYIKGCFSFNSFSIT